MASTIALDRPSGGFSVDSNGAACYSLPFELPPGTGRDNTPQLSLQYNQGTPNGLTGIGWSLSGISSVQRAPRNLAIDGSSGPISYDSDNSRLALNGVELILSQGQYGQSGAQYVFEINDTRLVTTVGQGLQLGFKVTDATGRTEEYGTTDDSRALSNDGTKIREWRIARNYDIYGNCMSFSYTNTPRLLAGKSPVDTAQDVTYPDRIAYSSNQAQNAVACRFVDFYYSARDDQIVATGAGDVFVMAYRLARVEASVMPAPEHAEPVQARAYNIEYIYSQISNASLACSITEEGASGTWLAPTTVTYNSSLTNPNTWFKPGPSSFTLLAGVPGNVMSLIPLHVSGDGMSDLALITQSPTSGQLTMTTYLAQMSASDNTSLTWGAGSSYILPTLTGSSIPTFLACDLDGNGRNDLVMAFNQSGVLNISISHCTGSGFIPSYLYDASRPWIDGDVFFAMDCNGDGQSEIVQISSFGGNVSICIYYTVSVGDQTRISNVISTPYQDDASNTIQWFPADVNRDGLQDLVRIWYQPDSRGLYSLMATAYVAPSTSSQDPVFQKQSTVLLGSYTQPQLSQLSIVPCDINADGIQDLVTCQLTQTWIGAGLLLTFDFNVFLCDGAGGFRSYSSQTLTYTVSNQWTLIDDANLSVADLDGTGVPSITYRFKDSTGSQNLLVAQGGYDAQVSSEWIAVPLPTGPEYLPLILPADVNGTAKAAWFAYSADQPNYVQVLPLYNVRALSDTLTSITSPLGLVTTPTYAPLSSPSVYRPAAIQTSPSTVEALRLSSTALPNQGPFESVLGYPQWVVSSFNMSNDPSISLLEVSYTTTKFYEGARIDLGGRGWQGFSNVYTVVDDSPTAVMVETLAQDWPLTGQTIQQDIYDVGQPAVSAGPQGFPPSLNPQSLASSKIISYDTPSTSVVGGTVYSIRKMMQKALMYDQGVPSLGSGTSYTYTDSNFISTESQFVLDPPNSDIQIFQKGTVYEYCTLGILSGVLIAYKTTTAQANLEQDYTIWSSNFLGEDIDLVKLNCDTNTGAVLDKFSWSIQSALFTRSSFSYDAFGNVTFSVDPAGLTKQTSYDSTFNTFPIQVEENGLLILSPLVTQIAFDARFGTKVATAEPNGMLTYVALDEFGREASTSITSLSPGPSTPISLSACVVAVPQLSNAIESQSLDLASSIEYVASPVGMPLMLGRKLTSMLAPNQLQSASQVVEYVDCAGRVQQTLSMQGTLTPVTIYKTFDSQNNITTESVPILIHQTPTPLQYKSVWYDALRRPIKEIRPLAEATGNQLLVTTQYSNGGSHVVATEAALPQGSSTPLSPPISTTTLDFSWCAGEAKVTTVTDSSQKSTTFHYDNAGNLTSTVDPALNADIINCDFQGKSIFIDNIYQNPTGSANKAMQYTYDIAGRKLSETNAMNQTNSFTYDAKGRLVTRRNFDGRTVTLTYDGSPMGLGNLTSASVSMPSSNDVESNYVFVYNQRGLPIQTQLFLSSAVGSSPKMYSISYSYDLQGQLSSKTLPDGSFVSIERNGGHALSCSLSSDNTQSPAWQVTGSFLAYDANYKCTDWTVASTGTIGTSTFYGKAGFDAVGALLSRSLYQDAACSVALVYENYGLDDLRRIASYQETVAGESLAYTYQDQRLHTSTPATGQVATYNFDDAGNLQSKNGIAFTYAAGSVSGTIGSDQVFSVQYDDCGRMLTRQHNGKALQFAYDGFGKTSVVTNQQTQQSINLLSDFLGRKLAQVNVDGSVNVQVSPDYSVTIAADGSELVERSLNGTDSILASVVGSVVPGVSDSESLKILFSNSKGSVTRIFNNQAVLQRQFTYDDFGMLVAGAMVSQIDATRTYESQSLSLETGLLEFGARSYDPILGRFTTPDDEWSNDPLTNRDVFNRYAFENNDPLNSRDPSGHWTGSSIAGLVVGIGLVVGAVAVTVLTAGLASPGALILAGAVIGGLSGAGFSAISYATTHQDTFEAGAYTANLFTGMATGAVTGAIVGAAGVGLVLLRGTIGYVRGMGMDSRAIQFLASRITQTAISATLKGAVGAGGAVVDQIVYNVADHQPWSKDLGVAAGWGAAFGFIGNIAELGMPRLAKAKFPKSFSKALSPKFKITLGPESWRALAAIADALNMITAIVHVKHAEPGRREKEAEPNET